jgi:acyl carrier protein
VNIEDEVIRILRTVLSLDVRTHALNGATPLLGHVAELDSMAVVSVLTAIEERFDIIVDDDEVDGRTFASVGSLAAFVQGKLDR